MSNEFVDEEFLPNEYSLMGKNKEGTYLDPVESRHKLVVPQEVEWRRIADIVPKPAIFEDTINMDLIKYGRVSLPYLYCVLSSLATHYPAIFNKIILTKEYNPEGKYEVRLYVDGEFKTIVVDDYFPCIRGTNVYYFTRPANFEMWPILIEKAWAKVNGGYLNIVNCWPGDFFRALTGFTYDEYVHPAMDKETLFKELDEVFKNKGLAFGLTIEDPEVEAKGLFSLHSYVLEAVEKVEVEQDKFVHLVKIRDAEEEANWVGDYAPNSTAWTEAIKSKISPEKLNMKDYEYWMTLEDYFRLFIRTDVCHMLTDGFTSYFKFDKLDTPKVFDFSVEEDGLVAISLLEKNWHYHRELRNISHPTSLIVAEYDPSNKAIKAIYSKYECNEDLDLTKTLKKGFYLAWAFKTKDPNEQIAPEELIVRFESKVKVTVAPVGDDVNFGLVKNIICSYLKEVNKDKIKPDDFFYAVDNTFDKSGIGYQMVINPLKNVHQTWKVDASATHGYLILPQTDKTEFEVTIGYEDYEVIVGIQRYKYGTLCLNLGIDASVVRGSQDPPKVEPKPTFDEFYLKDNSTFKPVDQNPTFPSAELTKVDKYPTVNHWDLFLEKYKPTFPLIIDELGKLQPLTDEKFDLNIIERNGNLYIGEADYGIRYGRGAYIFANEGTTYIGYWDRGLQHPRGKVFDKNNKLVFEGEYRKGAREGKGVYNYEGGEVYDGMFVNGKREGKGVFTWRDGLKWEGGFKNDDLNGEGTFTDGKETFNATFKDGEIVEN
ncbi:MAG TPA: hypothetical protein DEP51_02955 [Clostridiales bacterium]|nr:hypothetical protein [Clostridiales bacterium]